MTNIFQQKLLQKVAYLWRIVDVIYLEIEEGLKMIKKSKNLIKFD